MHEAKVIWQWLAGLVQFGSRIRDLLSDRQSRPGRLIPPQVDRGTAAVGARNLSSDGHFARAIFHGQHHPGLKGHQGHLCGRRGRRHMPSGFGRGRQRRGFLVSVTHLAFDRRLPVARKIAAYQKQSSTPRRDGSTDAPAAYHERQVVIAAGAPETPGAIYQ